MNEHIWVPFRLIYAVCGDVRQYALAAIPIGAINEVEANRFCRRLRTLCRRV